MSQAKMPDQPMDLNVIVAGGTREDRNLLTTLIADTLHQNGFDDVKRELAGEVDQSSLSVLEVIKDTRPHLFTETIHVTAAGDHNAMITDNDDVSTGDVNAPRTLMTFTATSQPPYEPVDPEDEAPADVPESEVVDGDE